MARVRREARNTWPSNAGALLLAYGEPAIRVRTPREIRSAWRPRRHRCWGHLIAAPLWPMHGADLGTLLRTCDAVGACLAVPPFGWVDEAIARGNTLRQPACVHRVGSPLRWLADERRAGATIVGVELADEAVRLADLPAARNRTVMVLGNEATGIPPEALDLLDGAWPTSARDIRGKSGAGYRRPSPVPKPLLQIQRKLNRLRNRRHWVRTDPASRAGWAVVGRALCRPISGPCSWRR